MSARKIDFYLDSSDRLRAFAHAARRVAELQQVFLNSAPHPLTQACRVKRLRAGTLYLLAENAAIAAKLKQLAPRLLTSYQKQRWQVTSIQVEVQVKSAAPDARFKREPKRLSLETIENLEVLAAGIEESPLKQALTRLAARQRDSN
jgi:hypothetical protein